MILFLSNKEGKIIGIETSEREKEREREREKGRQTQRQKEKERRDRKTQRRKWDDCGIPKKWCSYLASLGLIKCPFTHLTVGKANMYKIYDKHVNICFIGKVHYAESCLCTGLRQSKTKFSFSIRFPYVHTVCVQNYRWQKRKVRCLHRRFLKVGLARHNEECLSRRDMDTQRGWSVGAAGPAQQPDCVGVESRGMGAGPMVPNSSSLHTLFYSVIYNSVSICLYREKNS